MRHGHLTTARCSVIPLAVRRIRANTRRSACLKRDVQCEGSGNCLGFAARDASGVLAPYRFDRRPGETGRSRQSSRRNPFSGAALCYNPRVLPLPTGLCRRTCAVL